MEPGGIRGLCPWIPLHFIQATCFVFRATTTVNFGSSVHTATDSTGLIGAGNKASAIGGYAFSNVGAPSSGYAVRLFNKASEVSCSVNTKLVSQDVVDANGFYYI
jgi:hypothetical protein